MTEVRFLNDGSSITKSEEGIYTQKSDAESLPLLLDKEDGEKLFTEAEEVYVFELCECDSVAGRTLDEAMDWYKNLTGLEDEELYEYDVIKTLPHTHSVSATEEGVGRITVGEILEKYWKGEPFIAVTTGGN